MSDVDQHILNYFARYPNKGAGDIPAFAGRMVKVHVSFGRLVIETIEPERVPKAEVLESIARVSEGGLPKLKFQ